MLYSSFSPGCFWLSFLPLRSLFCLVSVVFVFGSSLFSVFGFLVFFGFGLLGFCLFASGRFWPLVDFLSLCFLRNALLDESHLEGCSCIIALLVTLVYRGVRLS